MNQCLHRGLQVLGWAVLSFSTPANLFASCGVGTTHVWLSPFDAKAAFADVPTLNTGGSTTVYVWMRLADGETVSDVSLNLISSTPIDFAGGVIDNPTVGEHQGKPIKRFEHTPEVTITPSSLELLQGFSVAERSAVGRGMGPATAAVDPYYDSLLDVWRLGRVTYRALATSDLALQVGVNGIQGFNAAGEITPEFSVVFGDAAESPLCAIFESQTSSSRPDARTTSGLLEADRAEVLPGSYWQDTDATLRLQIAGPDDAAFGKLTVLHTARLGGVLDLESIGYTGPIVRGTTHRFSLLSAAEVEGTFDLIRYDDSVLGNLPSTRERVRHHDEGGLFRTVQTNSADVTLELYLAVGGDSNGDRSVDFADFLLLSSNFGTPGNWTDGDFDGDGQVQFVDFLILSDAFGTVLPSLATSAESVPEPVTALGWTILGFLIWVRACRSGH